jgi:NAD(P)-dependent dehydrogenase (short-subunit alcohol dehydrogenase family)
LGAVVIPDLSDRPLTELLSLRGRSAVVTGGAKGLGQAIALRLVEAGASVLIGDVDDTRAAAAAAEIDARTGGTVVATPLDVGDPASISLTAETALARFGGIDIWVNNAGIYPSKAVLEMSDADWEQVIRVNLGGTFVGSREAARRMVAAGRGGVIVNVSSIAGIRGRAPGVAHYAASKHGIIGLTKQMALEFADAGIRVLAVAPTTIITPGVQEGLGNPADLEQRLAGPLGRAGRPDDVARVVLFCASDLAMFMTGSVVLVDGGEMAR